MKINIFSAQQQGASPKQIEALALARADGWEIDTHSTFLSRKSFEHKLVWNLRLFRPKPIQKGKGWRIISNRVTWKEPSKRTYITFLNKEV